MLVEKEDGSYEASGVQYKTPSDILNTSLKNHTVQTRTSNRLSYK